MLSPGLASGIVFHSLVLGEGEARGPLGGFPLLPAHGNGLSSGSRDVPPVKYI